MKTHCTFTVASFVLAAATTTCALAAPPNKEGEKSAPSADYLTTEAVVSDLVKFRQTDPTRQQPRDGEWYNVPAPLGSPMALKVGYEDAMGSDARAMPSMQRTDDPASPGQ